MAQHTHIREAILDATDRLLARYGYKKMTMDDVAREAGIGKGTTYLYFSSKQELTLASIDRLIDRLLQELHRIAKRKATVQERIRQMLHTRVLYRFDHVLQNSLSIDEMLAAIRAQFLVRREIYFAKEAQVFAQVVEEGQHSGIFVHGRALTMAHTLLLATNSLLPYSLSADELGKRAHVEQKIRPLADLLVRGLLSAPKKNSSCL